MKKTKKKKRKNTSEFRVLKRDEIYSIIEVYLDHNRNIVGYSDYIIPTAIDTIELKMLLSSMLIATRKMTLTDDDLNFKIK
jgi:hypothetical protein